jgi:uncharacterized membrane protein SpoIIM required for sporulation
MVLEHVFPEDWLEKKTRYAFLLGIGYSIIGILISSVLFPSDPALVAVAFTALLLLPELYKIFTIEEKQQMKQKRVTLKTLIRCDWDVTKIYIFLFLGIMLTYAVATMWLPTFQANNLFREQMALRGTGVFVEQEITGFQFTPQLFQELMANNFKVMFACFVLAFLTGNGAIFLITWNASVWGTVFGITAKCAAEYAHVHPVYYFLLIMVIVFPHMLLEAMAYFLAAISGSIISKDVLFEVATPNKNRFWFVFKFNMYLLLLAVGFVLVGAFVETIVLDNVTTYATIIKESIMGIC